MQSASEASRHSPESVRACFRAACRYVLRGVAAQVDASGGDATSAFVMIAVMNANLDHIDRDPELARGFARFSTPVPDEARVPVSALSIAGRLGLPRETVRRRLAQLVEAGRCLQDAKGFYVPMRVLAAGERREVALQGLAAARRLRRDLLAEAPDIAWTRPGADAPRLEEGDDPPTRIVSRHGGSLGLDIARPLADLTGGYEEALAYMAVVDATLRSASPDAHAALPGLTIAQSIERPTESVRRRMTRLVELGLIAREDRGFTARHEPRMERELEALGLAAVEALQRFFSGLARHGVHLD